MKIIDEDLIGGMRSAYLIGIGGVGMSALARVLKFRGLSVSGSDRKENSTTLALSREGIAVRTGQDEPNIGGADVVIYSSAIRGDNPELQIARRSGKKVYHRAQVLASLLNRAETFVAVAGTHGKTTTSSMISFVLADLGKRPTCLVGGDVLNFGTNTVLGNSNLWISEVDESDQTHELYAPNYAVLTNLEEDHMDHYKNSSDLAASFERFLSNMRNPGLAIYSADDPLLSGLVRGSGKPAMSFGLTGCPDLSAGNIEFDGFGVSYDLFEAGFFAVRIDLAVPGIHNVKNSLAAIAVLLQLGVGLEEIAVSLAGFRGTKRRLEVKWHSDDLTVIDDYAHHPTEVRASLAALSKMNRRLTVIFQPHRFSRTKYFFKEFACAFEGADELILTDIYGAGELNSENVCAESICQEILAAGDLPVKILPKQDIINHLIRNLREGGIVAFLGAGDIGEVADEFAGRCQQLAAARR
jgi:UDP-N-acetylmuramate--alanine ligase